MALTQGTKAGILLLLVLMVALLFACKNDVESPNESDYIPGRLMIGFENYVIFDSAVVIVKQTGYQVIDLNMSFTFFADSSYVDVAISFLAGSKYVRNGEIIKQLPVVQDGKKKIPLFFESAGRLESSKYYYDLLKCAAGDSVVSIKEGSGSAEIIVPVGQELDIAEELINIRGIAYAEPNRYGSVI
jgi:hypothetical protein